MARGYTTKRLGPKPKRVARYRYVRKGGKLVLIAFTPGPHGKGHAIEMLTPKKKRK